MPIPNPASWRAACVVALIAASGLFACGGSSTPSTGATTSVHGTADSTDERPVSGPAVRPPFSPDSFWNTPLPRDASVDPSSKRVVAHLVAEVDAEEAAHRGPWVNTSSNSIPVYEVGPGQPTVHVTLDHQPDKDLIRAWSAVPLPASAMPAKGSDQHLVVYQPSTDRLWEFYELNRRADGWHAQWGGAMRDVSKSSGVYTEGSWPGAKTYWGASATSLSILGGLIRIDELRRGEIDHVLALSVPRPRAHVYARPAQREDGLTSDPAALTEGARLRIDPNVDLDKLGLTRPARIIAEAAQKYGMIVRDKAGVIAFSAEDPSRFKINPYAGGPTGGGLRPNGLFGGKYPSDFLRNFPWQHLQVMKMDVRTRR